MSDVSLAPGKRLSQIRQQLGLSQRRVAELSGLTHSAISTIEQDKVSPAISTLQKLLRVYGLSLSAFFAEPEKPTEPQIVIGSDDLIEIGNQGVSMKLIHNGDPNRTLAMMIETYEPGTTTGERIKHQGEEIGRCWKAKWCCRSTARAITCWPGKATPSIPASPQFQQHVGAHLPDYQRPYADDILINGARHELSPFAVLATTGAGPED